MTFQGFASSRQVRARRSCLSVPGSNPRMLGKAKSLPVDMLFCDLEDSVAPDAKEQARANVVAALREGGWSAQTVSLRINGWATPWTYQDLITVVAQVGNHLDGIVLPKASEPHHVQALDLLLTQLEENQGLPLGKIGIEVQIEDASGLLAVNALARCSDRVESLVLGPADLMASLATRTLVVGEQPPGYEIGDAYHHVLMSILIAARANGIQAIDGPYLNITDDEGFRRVASRSAALGFDGKWVVHPDQIASCHEVFSPSQSDYDDAEEILDVYGWYTSQAGGLRGAVRWRGEMLDEASRKMALVVAGKGRAAGMSRTRTWQAPNSPLVADG